jgi:hypothetical protein
VAESDTEGGSKDPELQTEQYFSTCTFKCEVKSYILAENDEITIVRHVLFECDGRDKCVVQSAEPGNSKID